MQNSIFGATKNSFAQTVFIIDFYIKDRLKGVVGYEIFKKIKFPNTSLSCTKYM